MQGLRVIQDLMDLLEICERSGPSGLSSRAVDRQLQMEVRELVCGSHLQTSQCGVVCHALLPSMQTQGMRSILLKIRENMGLSEWIIANPEVIMSEFLVKYSCRLFLENDCQSFVLADSQTGWQFSNTPSNIGYQYNSQVNPSNSWTLSILLSADNFEAEWKVEEIIRFFKLQRVFKNDYFLSFKYFPKSIIDSLAHDVTSVTQNGGVAAQWNCIFSGFEDVKKINENLYESLSVLDYDFERYSLIEEQLSIGQVSSKEISESIHRLFGLQHPPLNQLISNEYYEINMFFGIQECGKHYQFQQNKQQDKQLHIYLIQNNNVVLSESCNRDHQEIVRLLQESFEPNIGIVQTKKTISNSLCHSRVIGRQRKSSALQKQMNLFLVVQVKSDIPDDRELWSAVRRELSPNRIQSMNFLQLSQTSIQVATHQHEVNNILQFQIPHLLDLITDISEIFGEPFQLEEQQLIHSALSKIFLINLL